MGGQRHGDGLGDDQGQSAMQDRRPGPRPPDDAATGQHGQGETHRPAQERVEHQQQQHGQGEIAHAGPTTPGAQGGQGDQTHGGRAQHAGLGPAQRDEDQYAAQPDQAKPPAPQADPPGRGQQESQQQREVRSRHRRQVAQSGALEIGFELGGQAGGVAQHQSRHQGPRFGRTALHRGPEPVSHPFDHAEGRVRAGNHRRRGADSDHGGHSRTGIRRLQPGWAGQPGPDRPPRPVRRRIAADHDQPRRPHPPGGTPASHLADPDRHGGVAGPGPARPGQPRVGADLQQHLDHGVRLRQPGNRSVGQAVVVQAAGRRQERDHQPDRQHPCRPAYRPDRQHGRRTDGRGGRWARAARGAAPGGAPARHGQWGQPQIVPRRLWPGRVRARRFDRPWPPRPCRRHTRT